MASAIRVLLFARLREICGASTVELSLDDAATPAECFDRLAARHRALASVRDRVMVAVNSEYAGWADRLSPGDEVAFIPPVSGG